ncbi:MAG TPA: cytochrome c biogenesis protein CcsA [Anaeromyxobacteraceae bacterium]|jgi:cytochrome c-type biogenesis protein CcsB|nr:cytochrome c biogenesis protein CcsA [Anaeromyxobacteraceae bacterium]
MPRTEAILVTFTLVLYAVSFSSSVAALAMGRERLLSLGRWTALCGLGLHAGALAARWAVSGHAPVATPYENASTGAWSIVLLTFLAPRRWRLFRGAGAGAMALALIILGWGTTGDTSFGPMAPSLRSVWLYVHVFFAFLAYAGFSVASGTALGYLWKAKRGEVGLLARLPVLEDLDLTVFRYVVFGFITCAVMIAAGSIWAKDLWGAYWSWDPVETWSLVAWLTYGVLIHLRVTYGWKGRRFAWFALLAIVLVIVAYFGVGQVVTATQHVFTVPEPPIF